MRTTHAAFYAMITFTATIANSQAGHAVEAWLQVPYICHATDGGNIEGYSDFHTIYDAANDVVRLGPGMKGSFSMPLEATRESLTEFEGTGTLAPVLPIHATFRLKRSITEPGHAMGSVTGGQDGYFNDHVNLACAVKNAPGLTKARVTGTKKRVLPLP